MPPTAAMLIARNQNATGNTAMPANSFNQRLHDYKQWRDDLVSSIGDYQAWIEQQGLGDGQQDLQIHELIESLKSDKLVIAFVAEFSRGKTELINAIFFADYKQRLLPSAAGRTTMCPTELLYDEKQDPYIKLLPIETRKTAVTIAEYKHTPIHWTTLHIHKPHAPQEVSEAFQEIVRTKKVSLREAHELGLYESVNGAVPSNHEMIDVPVWRHAIINFPHPLLKQGLVVLDTPGLNSLGTEPELTFSTLPAAHAVLFILAADAGVTKSDLEVWNNHVCMVTGKDNGKLAILNKIDFLWDELQDENEIATNIARQVDETASILGIDKTSIFAVSAQKGLIGKIKVDEAMLHKSGLLALENKLAQEILPEKHKLIREKLIREISGRIQNTTALVAGKLKAINDQLTELKSLGGKNLDAIRATVGELRKEKAKYDKELQGFQATRELLARQAEILFSYLSMDQCDRLITKTRREMQDSWTTRGLRVGIVSFFAGAVETMEKADKQAKQIKNAVESIYHKFHTEYGFTELKPAVFSLADYHNELIRIQSEGEVFGNSSVLAITEQHFVIKKFFITLVSHARNTFNEANTSAKNWFQAIISPLFIQIRDHKVMMDQRIDTLKKVQENLDSLSVRVAELEKVKKDLESQQKTIETMQAHIERPLPYH
jgi:hypothetical protein